MTEPGDAAAAADRLADPAYRAGVVDLLGALAYGELSAFLRLAGDAALAPTLSDATELSGMASAEFRHHDMLRRRIAELGVDPDDAMQPFVASIDAFHASTAPSDWYESLVKAFVGDGIGRDFYREVAQHLDPTTKDLVEEVVADTGHSEFAVDRVREAIAADPRIAGRLALWGRRLVGEMLSQAQTVAAERDALAGLVVGLGDGTASTLDLAEVGRMFGRLTQAHTQRMQALGLSA